MFDMIWLVTFSNCYAMFYDMRYPLVSGFTNFLTGTECWGVRWKESIEVTYDSPIYKVDVKRRLIAGYRALS